MILKSGEEVIMSSNNNQIVLTNKRIIQDDRNTVKDINLSDYVGYEIINKKYNFYIIAFLVCIVLSFFVFNTALVYFLLIFSAGFLYFFFTNHEQSVKIKGKSSTIEFSRKGLSEATLYKFLHKIEELREQ